ncbi:histidinol-phosphate transaminase [soil metagenome]
MAAPRPTRWKDLVRPSLHGIEPYQPGPSLTELKERYGVDEIVKLNWNEGLFGPFPGALAAAAAELENAWMYPEQAFSDLREAVCRWRDVPPEQIVPAHGIQSLVRTVADAFLGPGDSVVLPEPTYGLYAQVFAAAGASIEYVPCPELRLDLDEMAASAARVGARLIVVCDPNNPTGSLAEQDEWDRFLDAVPERCAVVVDEAYCEYVDPARRIRREDDVAGGRSVILLRTFSKIFGLAGLRLGYAVVSERLASYLDVVQEPFHVTRAALAAGTASLQSPEIVEERRIQAAESRKLLTGLLEAADIDVHPSQANFVLARVGVDDVALTDGLASRGFLIRAGSEFGMAGAVRITVAPLPLMEKAARELIAVRSSLFAGNAVG